MLHQLADAFLEFIQLQVSLSDKLPEESRQPVKQCEFCVRNQPDADSKQAELSNLRPSSDGTGWQDTKAIQ